MKNTIFKNKLNFLLAFGLAIMFSNSQNLIAQDHYNLFKTIPPIEANTPEWAKLMYSVDPIARSKRNEVKEQLGRRYQMV